MDSVANKQCEHNFLNKNVRGHEAITYSQYVPLFGTAWSGHLKKESKAGH